MKNILRKTAAVIEAMGALTILALPEVESIGVLEDVAAEPADDVSARHHSDHDPLVALFDFAE